MSLWETREAPPPLADDEVHVWRAGLALAPERLAAVEQTLSADERARAGRFRFPRDREAFTVARGTLRRLLGGYLALEPAALVFRYGPNGKPELAPEQGGSLRFNLSHSGELALYAFTRNRDLGIDIEAMRPESAQEAVARRFFSPRETSALLALPPKEWMAGFYRCWTRKEAFVKATGRGLTLPLHQFDVSVAPGEPARLLRTAWDPDEAARWSLLALDPGPGYTAALAVKGHGWRLRLFQFV